MQKSSRPQTTRTKIRRAVLVCEHPLLGERMVSQSRLERKAILGMKRLAFNECPQKGSLRDTAERVVRRLYGTQSDLIEMVRLGMFSQRGLLPHDVESTVFLMLPTDCRFRRVFNELLPADYVKPNAHVLHELRQWRNSQERLLKAS